MFAYDLIPVWMPSGKLRFEFPPFLYNIKPFYYYRNLLRISITVLSQCKNMSKVELIQELTVINWWFVNDINARLTDLSESFNEFNLKYDKVYSELQQCKVVDSHLNLLGASIYYTIFSFYNSWVNHFITCLNEWMNEWMNEWVNERMNEWSLYSLINLHKNFVKWKIKIVLKRIKSR